MKKLIVAAACAILSLTAHHSNAQGGTEKKLSEMASYSLEISSTKTSNVVFPYAIISVDRGSKDILAQKATGVENILQVKAAREGIGQSNLSVVTADGKLTTFLVSYSENPTSINLSLDPSSKAKENSVFVPKDNINEAEIKKYSEIVYQNREYSPSNGKENSGIVLNLKSIFIKDGILYFQFKVTNWSNIRYDIDQFRFFIRDQKKANRTSSQEVEIPPIYVNKELTQVPGKSVDMYVFSLPKFTIPNQKFLAVQLMEKDGGRHVEMKVSNRQILKARPLR